MAIGLGGTLAVTGGPAGAQDPEPTLAVEPSTELLDGQTVQVSGTGFLPNTTVYILSCLPGATSSIGCDTSTFRTVNADENGSFATDYDVVRRLEGIDCAEAACRVGAGDIDEERTAVVEVSFADVPLPPPPPPPTGSITLIDPGPLGPFESVEVSGSGFPADTPVGLRVCGPDLCAPVGGSARTDSNGAFASASVLAARLLPEEPFPDQDSEFADCLLETCRVEAAVGDQVVDETDALQYPVPELAVSIAGQGTLDVGTNDAVVRATVSCDQFTPVSVQGGVAQPGLPAPSVAGGFAFDDARCRPGDPLHAFIPTRDLSVEDTDFALGQAEAEVAAAPYRALDDGPAVESTGTVELLDYDALASAIQAALTDPDNTELRGDIQAAIRARIA